MTEIIDTAQPEALRLAAGLEEGFCSPRIWLKPAAKELRRLHYALAAAEARNATLTDDAARYVWLTSHSDGDEQDDILQWLAATVVDKDRIDVTIDRARAAASISTKGDGQ